MKNRLLTAGVNSGVNVGVNSGVNSGVNRIKTIKDINQAIKYVGEISDGDITILTTYTALLKINKNKEIK